MSAPASPALEPELVDRLRDRLGPDAVLTDPDGMAAYEQDALTTVEGRPLAVLRPADRAGVQAAIHTLSEAGVPFLPRGAGSGLAGSSIPRGEVVISTERMDRVLEVDPEDRVAVVEPAVITDEVSRAAEPHGLRYLPDPASGSMSSIGGNVATNAGGPHCLRYGVTTDHVLGLEIVTPTGALATLRRGEDGGLDLGALFVGSEGTLGVVTRIELRLVPRPEAVRTALATFDRLEDAGRAVSEILAAGVVPAALELVDRAAIRAVEASEHAAGLPTDVEAALLVECEGLPDEADAALMAAGEALERCGAREIMAAADEGRRKRLWTARKKAYEALEPTAPDIFIQDANVPRTALPELLPRIREIADRHGLEVVNFFHAGDGNLHPNIPFDHADPDQARRLEAASEEIMRLCVEAGGTITGEHGVGLDKKKHMRLVFGEAELELQRAARGAFDPAGLCNAGKVFPE